MPMLNDTTEEQIQLAAFAKAAARLAAQEAAAHNALSREQVEEIAERAVTAAFRAFGLDPASEESVARFRTAMSDVASWRKVRMDIWSAGIKAIAGAIFLGGAVVLLKALLAYGVVGK